MAEIVQSTEHSIKTDFVRPGSENKVEGQPREADKKGTLRISIAFPSAAQIHVTIDDNILVTRQHPDFPLSIEGAAALQTALMRMLNFRQMHVLEDMHQKADVKPADALKPLSVEEHKKIQAKLESDRGPADNKAVTEMRENAPEPDSNPLDYPPGRER
jgi:hypothetical protein